ncbi:MAG: ABC transporter C-terminal domain-containing protein [Gracilimonas sp.]|nr:ABC transporter C-terminal domain-containing protein [Gracilimonas sp.]
MEAERRNERNRRTKPVRDKIQSVEKEIEKIENRIGEIEEAMAEPDFYDDADKVKKFSLEYDQLKADLTDRYSQWEENQQRLEVIEAELGSEQ